VNIGMVNELALMCHRMDIDVWEVIDAARTKPFGFMPFYPGPGLGGHCIPIDPFYLSWKARQSGFEARFIELAGQVNGSMPEWVVTRVSDALNTVKKAVNGSRVHVYGVAYKRNVGDMRESPALDVIEHLVRRGATVTYSDPYVPFFKLDGHTFSAISPAEALAAGPDCVVITTDHDVFDYKELVEKAALIMDTRNALKAFPGPHIFRL
jgi:UDP-N-acetyl-D-glucosamine dehydrogenase